MNRDIDSLRGDFPVLQREIGGKPLVYLDNAATTQLPRPVIDAVCGYYESAHANVHRGIHSLSERGTARIEAVRRAVGNFIGARGPDEIIFTSGATHAINLAARALGNDILKPGDEVLCTVMEHHSNYLPWLEVCRRTGAVFKAAPLNGRGELDMAALRGLLNEKTRLVAAACVSNVTGAVNPVSDIAGLAREAGALVLLDAAQAMRHGKIDVTATGCDLLCFSAHKMLGPTGTGVLYAKRELLETLRPESFGGGMVAGVTGEEAVWEEPPARFEAGTPNIAGIIGLGAAIEYINDIGLDVIAEREEELTAYLLKSLSALAAVHLLGPPRRMTGAVSFNIGDVHFFDAAKLLDSLGIALRSGTHCARPLMDFFGVPGVLRASPAFYNTEREIDCLLEGVERVAKTAGRGSGL